MEHAMFTIVNILTGTDAVKVMRRRAPKAQMVVGP